jgi:hypothetical protein
MYTNCSVYMPIFYITVNPRQVNSPGLRLSIVSTNL